MSKTSYTAVHHWLHTRQVPDEGPPEGWTAFWDYIQEYTNSVSSDGPVADYRGKISRNESATTHLSGVDYRMWEGTTDRIFFRRYVTDLPFISGGIEVSGGLGSLSHDPIGPSDALVPSVQNLCKQRIIAQIRGANTTLQGLVSAGELGETVRLVNGAGREVFRGLPRYLSDVNRIVRSVHPRNLLRSISRRWLEYSFGWKPLINDLDSGMKALARLQVERQPRVLVRTGAQSKENHPLIETVYGVPDYEITVITRRESVYGMRIYGCVALTPPGMRFAHEFGIKLDEFIPTIWELIPYSFLVDYFTNCGAVIDSFALNTSGVRWLAQGEMSSNNLENQVIPRHTPPAGWTYHSNELHLGKPTTKRFIVKSRAPISTSDLQISLEFKIPGSSTKWLNIGALAAQHATTTRNVRRALRA